MGLMPEGSELLPLFRRIDRGKVRGQYFRAEGIGYSRMSECVKAALFAIGEDPSRYGLHSFRSGVLQRWLVGLALIPEVWRSMVAGLLTVGACLVILRILL